MKHDISSFKCSKIQEEYIEVQPEKWGYLQYRNDNKKLFINKIYIHTATGDGQKHLAIHKDLGVGRKGQPCKDVIIC